MQVRGLSARKQDEGQTRDGGRAEVSSIRQQPGQIVCARSSGRLAVMGKRRDDRVIRFREVR